MHRVVVKRLDHHGKWIVEAGPWHVSRTNAENWAEILRHLGYHARIETLHEQAPYDPGDHRGRSGIG